MLLACFQASKLSTRQVLPQAQLALGHVHPPQPVLGAVEEHLFGQRPGLIGAIRGWVVPHSLSNAAGSDANMEGTRRKDTPQAEVDIFGGTKKSAQMLPLNHIDFLFGFPTPLHPLEQNKYPSVETHPLGHLDCFLLRSAWPAWPNPQPLLAAKWLDFNHKASRGASRRAHAADQVLTSNSVREKPLCLRSD